MGRQGQGPRSAGKWASTPFHLLEPSPGTERTRRASGQEEGREHLAGEQRVTVQGLRAQGTAVGWAELSTSGHGTALPEARDRRTDGVVSGTCANGRTLP